MTKGAVTSAFNETSDGTADINRAQLAVVMKSEAPDRLPLAQQMVGWTVLNRMKQYHHAYVSQAWAHNNYAHNQAPSSQTSRIAADLLSEAATDISQGAKYFYSPQSMPKEGDSTSGWDVGTDLEQVRGVTDKKGQPAKNYVPKWAKTKTRIYTPSIPEKDFKFYK